MYNTLQKVKQALETAQNMTPAEYAALDDDEWQLVQDVRDCCKALADRVDVLELLQPIPPASADAPCESDCMCLTCMPIPGAICIDG